VAIAWYPRADPASGWRVRATFRTCGAAAAPAIGTLAAARRLGRVRVDWGLSGHPSGRMWLALRSPVVGCEIGFECEEPLPNAAAVA